MPDVASGIGHAFLADDFNQSIQNALQRRDEMRTEFDQKEKERKDKEKNDVYSEYLTAIRPDYKGINPILYGQYHEKYMDYAHKLVDAFKGAESQPEMTASFSDILGQAEGTRNGLINSSKGWNALQEENPSKLNVEQQGIRKWYDSGAWMKNSDEQNKEYLKTAFEKQLGGSISFDPQTMALGMASTPSIDWNKKLEEVGGKLAPDEDVKEADPNGAWNVYKKVSDKSVKQAYEGLISSSGTQVKGLALSKLMNDAELYNDDNNWQTDEKGNRIKDSKTGTGVPSQSYIDKFNNDHIQALARYTKTSDKREIQAPYRISESQSDINKQREMKFEPSNSGEVKIGENNCKGGTYKTYDGAKLGNQPARQGIDLGSGKNELHPIEAVPDAQLIYTTRAYQTPQGGFAETSDNGKNKPENWMAYGVEGTTHEGDKKTKKKTISFGGKEFTDSYLVPFSGKQLNPSKLGYTQESYYEAYPEGGQQSKQATKVHSATREEWKKAGWSDDAIDKAKTLGKIKVTE